jgi:hypothetical protein
MSSLPAVVSTLPVANVSPDVWEYARKEGIEAPVRYLVEATPRVFPTASAIKVYLKADPEIKDLWFIVYEVHVSEADVPDYVAAHTRWGEEWEQGYPYPRNHSLVLSLRLVEL